VVGFEGGGGGGGEGGGEALQRDLNLEAREVVGTRVLGCSGSESCISTYSWSPSSSDEGGAEGAGIGGEEVEVGR